MMTTAAVVLTVQCNSISKPVCDAPVTVNHDPQTAGVYLSGGGGGGGGVNRTLTKAT